MNRDAIRDLAASELGLTTSTFEYARPVAKSSPPPPRGSVFRLS